MGSENTSENYGHQYEALKPEEKEIFKKVAPLFYDLDTHRAKEIMWAIHAYLKAIS